MEVKWGTIQQPWLAVPVLSPPFNPNSHFLSVGCSNQDCSSYLFAGKFCINWTQDRVILEDRTAIEKMTYQAGLWTCLWCIFLVDDSCESPSPIPTECGKPPTSCCR